MYRLPPDVHAPVCRPSTAQAGPCNAGKTCLFYQLKDGSTHLGTVASMQENEGTVPVRSDKDKVVGSARVVDVPGHAKLRHKAEKHLQDAAAVVFVVDATDITPHKVEAAEELFEVLTHPSVVRRRVPVLIACNKMDQEAQAHSMEFVRKTLEKQLDAMRKTRTTLSTDAPKVAAAFGKGDKPLSLAALRTPVSVAGISAAQGSVADVHAFMAKALRL